MLANNVRLDLRQKNWKENTKTNKKIPKQHTIIDQGEHETKRCGKTRRKYESMLFWES